jgi:lysyl-tRNA synthetase, class II
MSIENPDYHQFEEFQNRSQKLKEIKDLGIDPYPHKYMPTHDLSDLQEIYTKKEVGQFDDAASGSSEPVKVAGRMILFRAMGKNAFGQIQDEKGRIQIMFNRDLTKVEGLTSDEIKPIKFIEKKIDLGDIVGIEGNLFRTQKGELTVFAKKVTILCKTLLPLPDKHSGLADKGMRYRKRWLDLIVNKEAATKLLTRSTILKLIRNYFDENNFVEVETPILQNIYGGAEARPFTTKLNALDQEMYLRISLEIALKKLLVGGMTKIFEIGKVFRNEGIDRTHNPEFTLLEAYASFWDYNDLMTFMENMYEMIAKKLFNTTKLEVLHNDKIVIVDVKAPWKRISMKDSLKEYANIDFDKLSDDEARKKLEETKSVDPKKIKSAPRGILMAMLFEEFVEDKLIEPHHIIDHPIETTPLCKLHRDPKERENRIVERFESFILGGEASNAYSELNDPELQRELLLEQVKKKDAGDEEAHPLDEEFIEAICQGMPPAAGIGIGIDRLVMLFTNAVSIRDAIYFPMMKPEE